MTAPTKAVMLQDIVVHVGPEPGARQYAANLVLQIRERHTTVSPARRAYVTACAIAIARGDADDFTPEAKRNPWTVRLVDLVADTDAAAGVADVIDLTVPAPAQNMDRKAA